METVQEMANRTIGVKADILIDTREKDGFTFEKAIPSNFTINKIYRETLDCGDYSISGYDLPHDDDSIIIERKRNIEEFCVNISTNWGRFKNQLEKMSYYKVPLIIIEDTLHNIYSRYNSHKTYVNLPPNFIIKRVVQIKTDYNVDTLFLGSKSLCQQYVCQLFREIISRHE